MWSMMSPIAMIEVHLSATGQAPSARSRRRSPTSTVPRRKEMPLRPPRARRLVALLGAALLGPLMATGTPPAPARAADLPPQEPGVTLRTYDIRVPLAEICTLKPGQTPNVDKLMPVVDWSSAADFGF